MVNFSFMGLVPTLTNLTSCSLYCELWHIQNPDILIIRGIFRTLEYSKFDGTYIPVKYFAMSIGNSSRLSLIIAERSFLDHFWCLVGFWISLSLCIYKCYATCKVVLDSRAYSHIFKTVSIPGISEPWHVQKFGGI